MHAALLTGFAAILACFAGQSFAGNYPRCRCLSNQSCWPSAASWTSFNSTLGGKLIGTKPIAYNCYAPNFDATKCGTARNNSASSFWRGDQPGALQYQSWSFNGTADQGCPLDPAYNGTCKQGAVSVYVVNATTSAHVVNTVKFATANNLRLVIKNTGHDYFGRSSAPGSLTLWTHYMRGITFNSKFVPQKCSSAPVAAVKIGAGEQWGNVYAAANKSGLVVVGGASRTVGAAGAFTQGGGHGPLTRNFGLAADNVLEFEVVLASGALVVANDCQNSDLFWALRGGGGGTYGVVVSSTHKTYPTMKTVGAEYAIVPTGPGLMGALFQKWISMLPSLDKAGWSGYFSSAGGQYLFLQLYMPYGDLATANKTLQPLFDFINSKQGSYFVPPLGYQQLWLSNDFFSAYNTATCNVFPTTNCTDGVGNSPILGSRLIPGYYFQTDSGRAKVSAAVNSTLNALVQAQTGIFLGHLVAGRNVSSVNADAIGLNPAWRLALVHIVIASSAPETANATVWKKNYNFVNSTTQILRDLAPISAGGGAYVNEALPGEPNWQATFFGEHYKRLFDIKNTVDPDHFFTCKNCVGSEYWNEDGNCPPKP